MSRKPEIAKKPGVVISTRFDEDVVEMMDLLTDNRSQYVRDAAWDKINKDMEHEDRENGSN